MDDKNRSVLNDHNFLQDEDFIRWRLFRTKESDEYWENILSEYPHLKKAIDEAIIKFNSVEINRNQLSEEDKKDVYKAVLLNIRHYKRRRLMLRVGSAAAVFIIGILSVLFFTHKGGPVPVESQESGVIIGQTLPQEEIILISGETRINIANKSHIGLTGNGRALVSDSTDSPKELLLAKAEINKLVVPFGKRTNLTLSDGTEVWLNSGTQLDFPSAFGEDKREIRVNGEIFIHVAHNPRVPFVVRAQEMDVYVYGTSFNISAYNDDSKKTVVLVEGNVKVKTANHDMFQLLPHEKLEVTDGDIMKEFVNVSEYISWTRGVLEFDEAPISGILKRIGRYYNVQFENCDDVKLNDKTCSGKLYLSNNLDSVMTSVSMLSSTVYKRENNIIFITKK